MALDKEAELERLLVELETLFKDPELAPILAERSVNASLALTAVQGLLSYVGGEKTAAAEDFEVVAEEIRARLALSHAADGMDH